MERKFLKVKSVFPLFFKSIAYHWLMWPDWHLAVIVRHNHKYGFTNSKFGNEVENLENVVNWMIEVMSIILGKLKDLPLLWYNLCTLMSTYAAWIPVMMKSHLINYGNEIGFCLNVICITFKVSTLFSGDYYLMLPSNNSFPNYGWFPLS